MILVSQAVQEFLSYLEREGRRPRTVEAYRGRLKDLSEAFGGLEPSKVLQADLEAFTVKGDEAGHGRATATVSMRVQAIKTFFQFCVNRGYIPLSPARALRRYERSKAEAHQVNDTELVTDLAVYDLVKSRSLDFVTLSDEFIQSLSAQGRRPRTIESYKERLSIYASYLVGFEVNQITPRQVDTIISIFRSHYAPASVAGLVQTIKTFFRFCMVRGYIGLSPAGHLKKPPITRIADDKVISQSDLENMIQAATDSGRTLDLCLLLFMADTGCRVGELMALDLADLDLTRMEARVNGKTGFRVLDFGEVTSEALKVWLDVRPKTDPVAVFTTREGRISHRCIYTHFEDLAADLGVKRFNPHSIRHRVGQSWVDSGANLELVRLKLGHKDVTTTARFYTHQDRERVKRASRKYSVIGGMQK